MMLPTKQKSSYFQQLFIISIALITFLLITSCECEGTIEPSPPQKTILPTLQLSITSLTYDPITNYITCTIENKEKQPMAGKLILKITQGQNTDATIQGAMLKDGKYEIELDEAIPIAGSPLTKRFEVQWATQLTNEFTFQAIYVKEKVATPVGNPALVSCNQTLLLVLKELKYDTSSGNITCIIENQGDGDINDIVVHWQAEPPDVQITELGNAIQERVVGVVGKGGKTSTLNLGQLDFERNTSARLTFWLTRGKDTTHYSKQSVEFQLPPISLKLEAVGPTTLATEKNKVFKIKITTSEADKASVYPAPIQLHIKKTPANSSAKILYDSMETTSLLGSTLGDIWKEIALEVSPDTEQTVAFAVQLIYGGEDKGEVKFLWYKEVVQTAFAAVKQDNLKALEDFLAVPGNLAKINDPDPDTGHTLLTQTILSLGDQGWEFIDLLLDKGAQINLLDTTGFNPLHTAITHDSKQITNHLLVKNTINIGIVTDNSANTPLHLAAYYGREKTMEQLLEKLRTNITTGKPTILNAQNKDRQTALQIAIEKKHYKIAQQLVAATATHTKEMADEITNELNKLTKIN